MDQEQEVYSDAELEILEDRYQRNLGLLERLSGRKLTEREIAILEYAKTLLVHPQAGRADSHQREHEFLDELEAEQDLAMITEETENQPAGMDSHELAHALSEKLQPEHDLAMTHHEPEQEPAVV